MRILTNEGRIRRGRRIGTIGAFGGLGILLIGLVVSFFARELLILWLALALLLLGIGVSSLGTTNLNRWMRQPRADEALAQALKGLDDQYRLYNYLLPAPHVLLGPTGLFVLTALGQDGLIRYERGKFHRNFSLGRVLRFMTEERLARPFALADDQVNAIRHFLELRGVEEAVEIQSVLVFYNPRAELTVTDPPRPVVTTKGLKKALRRQPESKLAPSLLEQLRGLFDSQTA